jgi:anti-sigma factor RsiW
VTPEPHLGDLLSALADGELASADVTTARAHLASCPACRGELAGTEEARAMVRSLPPVDPPVPLTLRRVPGGGGVAGAVAAAAAVVAVVLLPGVGEERPAPPVGRLVQVHATSGVNADPVSQLAPAAVPISLR